MKAESQSSVDLKITHVYKELFASTRKCISTTETCSIVTD